ncbi:MAG TPA: carbamoyltransferase HypF, partial [Candidatus Desulfofervidus auxilii]|nr:carbamoyltransferase HypF [Candidatus Desulfofervidus auxilii]
MHRVKVIICGVVQGVGFRPFIYQLAQKHRLGGCVTNTSTGVEIEVEGEEEDIEAFLKDISTKSPPLALINSIKTYPLTPLGEEAFLIKESQVYAHRSTLISPDVCICEDCLRELFDKNDRRYRYPFINCTNCGPRYTIIDDIPYDRANTSMRKFPMCKECAAEYNNPKSRRFHAQPNACFQCGPKVFLYDKEKRPIFCNDPILETIKLLKKGFIVAIKGLGGFHLAVDAENSKAVMKLREKKPRKEKPFAIMSKDLNAISQYANISQADRELLTSFQRPIVIVPKKEPNTLAEGIAPGIKNFGVMLPYTPLHYLLMEREFLALVMTSGNISEEPICIKNDEAFSKLKGIADYFLIHDRDILQRSDDSVCQIINEKVRLIRRSRGYVPLPIFFDRDLPQVLACGALEKNTICLTKENKAFISQHIGDLENLESLQFFEHVISHLKRILEIEPEIVAYDLHPQYLSTKWALEQKGIKLIGVQHHHAHILSCLAENGDFSKVIGLALDGTGYGEDERLWGSEVLVVDKASYKRLAHLAYRPLPGGEKAIKEPWRMAISYLYPIYGRKLLELSL